MAVPSFIVLPSSITTTGLDPAELTMVDSQADL
jgi:hypothetical protein